MIDRIAITRWQFLFILAALGLIAHGFAYPWQRQRTARVPIIALAIGGATALAIARFGHIDQAIRQSVPSHFYLVLTVTLALTSTVIGTWRWMSWTKRMVGIAGALAALTFFGAIVNANYGYALTIGDLRGTRLASHIRSDELIGQKRDARARSPYPSRIEGATTSIEIPGTTSRFMGRTAVIWVPPAYLTEPNRVFPVIVLLHGTPGAPDNWIRSAGAEHTANRYARTHNGVAPILVFPDINGSLAGDTECVNSHRGNAETYLSVDVPQFVKSHFRASTKASSWMIAGFSEGGTCSVMLALRHPDTFTKFADFSGDTAPTLGTKSITLAGLFDGNSAALQAHSPLEILKHNAPRIAGFFTAGTADAAGSASVTELFSASKKAGLDVQLTLAPGGHNFHFWKAAFRRAFNQLADSLTQADVVAKHFDRYMRR